MGRVYKAAFSLLCIVALRVRAEVPSLWAGLSPGSHAVGYLRLSGVDLWYPASAPGQPITFERYLGERAAETRSFLGRQGISAESVSRFLDAPMFATREAAPAPERFPLILFAQGNGGDAADQAILAEYFASHGFVVASVPSPMIRKPMSSQSQIAEFAEMQAAALEAAIPFAARVLHVDRERIGIVGHSFGARAALLLAMRQPAIRAFVSLDGGIGTATGSAELRAARSFHAKAHLPALLHFYEELDAFMKPDFALLKALHSARLVLANTDDMHHVHFTSYGFAAATIPEIATVTQAGPKIQESVLGVSKTALQFLQANLE
jgi:dienelactone hydrolase